MKKCRKKVDEGTNDDHHIGEGRKGRGPLEQMQRAFVLESVFKKATSWQSVDIRSVNKAEQKDEPIENERELE